MTQTTFTDNVLVDGSQDIKQLRVQGHTTQLQPIQTWEDSAGGTLAQVTGDGRLIVGDDVTPDSLIEAHRLETSTSKPKRGLHSVGQISGTLATLVQWIVGELELRGSTAIDALHTAFRIRAANLNTGTPTANAELRAADVEVINDATAGAAALPKATGLQVAVTNASGKTITDAAALRLKLNNAGMITNPYAIFSEGQGITHLEDFAEMKVPAAGVPTTPAANVVRLYPKSDGRLYIKNSDGTEFDLTGGSGASLSLQKWTAVNGFSLRAAAAVLQGMGVAVPTGVGTVTESNEATGPYINIALGNSAGAIQGIRTVTFDLVRREWSPTFTVRLKSPTTIATNRRIWIGLSTAAVTNSDTLPGDGAAFRYSTVAGDTGWMAVVRDGTTQSVSASPVAAIAADTEYVLQIRVDHAAGKIYFSVDGGTETEMNANLPRAGQELGAVVNVIITVIGSPPSFKFGALDCYWLGA